MFSQPPSQGKRPLSSPGTSRISQRETSWSYGVTSQSPDDFLSGLYAVFPDALIASVKRARLNLPKTAPSRVRRRAPTKRVEGVFRGAAPEHRRAELSRRESKQSMIPKYPAHLSGQPYSSSPSASANNVSACTACRLSSPASSSASTSGRSRSVCMPKADRKDFVVT